MHASRAGAASPSTSTSTSRKDGRPSSDCTGKGRIARRGRALASWGGARQVAEDVLERDRRGHLRCVEVVVDGCPVFVLAVL